MKQLKERLVVTTGFLVRDICHKKYVKHFMKPSFAGLNLCENTITDRGISIIVDRCLQVNDTLPIVSVKGPGIYSGEMYFNVESTSFIVIP